MFSSITLKNYRSYKESSFEFGEGVTIIIGPNASGKTNLLEAVYVLCQGSAFRSGDKDLIRTGSSWARADGVVNSQSRVLKLAESPIRTKKIIEIDDTPKIRLSFQETVPVVLFEPDDSRIIGGSPERRRLYIDRLLCNISPGYKKSLAGFKRALKQRNNLLKNGSKADSMFAWNMVLARHGAEIVTLRTELITRINASLSDIYGELASKEHVVTISYDCAPKIDNYLQSYLHRLEKLYELDRSRGFTSLGPHRDDIKIHIDDKDAGLFASRGEGRTITLALKILEMKLIEEVRGMKPILLLDDVFSELDGTRRRMLTGYLKDHQTIITTTDADIVGKKFARVATLISL
jgi:DNA replication and repair protein RecF